MQQKHTILAQTLAMLIAWYGATATTTRCAGQTAPAAPSLPFSIRVTQEEVTGLPNYASGIFMDYPYCPIAIDRDFWVFHKNGYNDPVLRFKGTNIENAMKQPDGRGELPRGAYILGGVWYDANEKKLYAPLHYEIHDHAYTIIREIHLATSTDLGLTWKYEGPIIASNEPDKPHTPGSSPKGASRFSAEAFDGGDGDHLLYVDERSGYFYIFTDHYTWPKEKQSDARFLRHCVARCLIADKMAPGKWRKFYQGAWNEPGIGGKASYVNGYNVTYNTYLKKYVSLNYLSGLSVCDDLATQQWSPSFHLGSHWGTDFRYWAFWPTNADKNDTRTSGKDFYVYSFFTSSPVRRFHVTLGEGVTKAVHGFTPSTVWFIEENKPHPVISADPGPMYDYTPFPESSDPIESRQTRRVGCLSPALKYTGAWSETANKAYYEGKTKLSAERDASVEFPFQGQDIYWRAAKGPDLGKADVFLDGAWQTTVDCWASMPTVYQYAFVKRGLSGDHPHTIKIVVKCERNPLSTGDAIKHLLFETDDKGKAK
ncbi:MAG: hypothetical protein ABSF26_29320 [Thermoguttaceae bacterium]